MCLFAPAFFCFWRPPRHNFLFYSYSFPDYRGRCCCRLCSFLLRSVLFEREKRCSCFFPSINPRNLGIWLDNWGHWCGNGANQQSSSINNAAQTQGCAGLERRLEGSLVAQIRAHAFVSVVEYLPSVSWSTVDASVCKDIICQTLTPSLPVCLTLCLPPPRSLSSCPLRSDLEANGWFMQTAVSSVTYPQQLHLFMWSVPTRYTKLSVSDVFQLRFPAKPSTDS